MVTGSEGISSWKLSCLLPDSAVDRRGIRDVILLHLGMSRVLREFLEIVLPWRYHGMTELALR